MRLRLALIDITFRSLATQLVNGHAGRVAHGIIRPRRCHCRRAARGWRRGRDSTAAVAALHVSTGGGSACSATTPRARFPQVCRRCHCLSQTCRVTGRTRGRPLRLTASQPPALALFLSPNLALSPLIPIGINGRSSRRVDVVCSIVRRDVLVRGREGGGGVG